MGLCGSIKKVSSLPFSISGLFSGKGGEGGMSQNKGILRSPYQQNNSPSSFLGAAFK